MSNNKSNERRVRVRAIRRKPLDVRKLSRALVALAIAQAQAESEAQAEHEKKRNDGGQRDVA
jgi:hypothetical protein